MYAPLRFCNTKVDFYFVFELCENFLKERFNHLCAARNYEIKIEL